MPAESATQQRLMETRARALATVLLTRRAGTLVRDASGDDGSGMDVCVTLAPPGKPGLRQFGVDLKCRLDPVTVEQGNRWLRERWPDLVTAGPFPFPVLVFLFTMRDNGAWYSWAAEPVVEDGGGAKLPLRTEPNCRPLTDEALEELLDRVDRWYDAHYAGLAA